MGYLGEQSASLGSEPLSVDILVVSTQLKQFRLPTTALLPRFHHALTWQDQRSLCLACEKLL